MIVMRARGLPQPPKVFGHGCLMGTRHMDQYQRARIVTIIVGVVIAMVNHDESNESFAQGCFSGPHRHYMGRYSD